MNTIQPDTYPANELAGVTFTGGLRHWVPAVHLPHGRAMFYPLTYPEVHDNGVIRATRSLMDQWLVADTYLGVLPLVISDQHTARAVAENWTAAVRTGNVDPSDEAQVLRWAHQVHQRVPERARLLRQVQWPPGLAPTPFHKS